MLVIRSRCSAAERLRVILAGAAGKFADGGMAGSRGRLSNSVIGIIAGGGAAGIAGLTYWYTRAYSGKVFI